MGGFKKEIKRQTASLRLGTGLQSRFGFQVGKVFKRHDPMTSGDSLGSDSDSDSDYGDMTIGAAMQDCCTVTMRDIWAEIRCVSSGRAGMKLVPRNLKQDASRLSYHANFYAHQIVTQCTIVHRSGTSVFMPVHCGTPYYIYASAV